MLLILATVSELVFRMMVAAALKEAGFQYVRITEKGYVRIMGLLRK